MAVSGRDLGNGMVVLQVTHGAGHFSSMTVPVSELQALAQQCEQLRAQQAPAQHLLRHHDLADTYPYVR